MTTVLSILAVAGNFAYWIWVVKRLDPWGRRWVARRYNVTVETTGRGHWWVTGPNAGNWFRRLRLEMLQLAFFMGAFVVWAGAILLLLVIMERLSP